MNYPFLIKHLGFVPSSMFKALREYCLAQPLYSRNDTNFDLTRHSGISGILGEKRTAPAAIQAVLDLPELAWAKHAVFEDHQVNLFKSGGHVQMHVDQTANGGRVFLRQKVHVPIAGTEGVEYVFEHNGERKVFKMELGGLYVFNDCVPHALAHTGAEDRVQLLLHWQDVMLYARDSLLR